jgi:hypothetical protein
VRSRFLSAVGALLLGAGALLPTAVLAAGTAIAVYRDPSCGCCGAWVDYLRAHGYTPTVHAEASMPAIKARLGVPTEAASCHTAVIGGYVIEGHVPAEDIQQLLAERPHARGLAVPGMPMGSPGMEMGTAQRYSVLLILADGSTQVFATHGPQA